MEPVIEMRHGVSRRARRFGLFLKIFIRPVLFYSPLTPFMLRMAVVFDWGAAVIMRPPKDTQVEAVRLDGFTAEWIRPGATRNAGRVILYLHGGAFFCCGLRTHRRLAARIAERSGAVALSVCYRQLPRHPLPVSMADAYEAYRWLLDQGHAPERVVIAGDSAGGFLAFTTVLAAAERGLAAPAGIVGLSPLVDFDDDARKAYEFTRRDAYVPAHRFARLKRLLLAGMENDPPPAPSDRDLRGLPPVLMMVGSEEALRYDAELMAQRLAAAGVQHRLQIWEGQVHVFQVFAGAVPEGHVAIGEIADFIRQVTTQLPEDAAA